MVGRVRGSTLPVPPVNVRVHVDVPVLVVLLALLVAGVVGCSRSLSSSPGDRNAPPSSSASSLPRCARVARNEVCWAGGPASSEPFAIDHVAPASEPLARFVPPFACTGGSDGGAERCLQRRPRHPSDEEWECSERTGVTVCRGGLAAAGVSAGKPEPGWLCGDHSFAVREGDGASVDAGAFRRICVDFAPDYPSPQGWSCRYVYVNDLPERECTRSPSTRAGDPCASGACPKGTQCVRDLCLPARPEVSCFFDTDCATSHECTFGTCRPRS